MQFFCPCENRVVLPPTTDNYFEIMGWYVVMLYLPLRPSEEGGKTLHGNALSPGIRILPLALNEDIF